MDSPIKHPGDYGVRTHPDKGISPCGNLVYIPLAEKDADEAARIYVEVFLADEPTTHTKSPDPARFLYYGGMYTRFLGGKKLSFIARDDRTHKIAGFIFCIDMAETPESLGKWAALIQEDFREAMVMINELEGRYINPDETPRGSMLHIFQVGVDRGYRGNGIAQNLIRRALDNGREYGFRQAVADCTNPASRYSFEQCGFREAGYSSYKEFSLDGDRFFEGCEGGIWLMIRDI
jgi:GNAT superfamily N-acetyltransferase